MGLRVLRDRPEVLYVKGNLRPDRRYVACIGTRSPTAFGETGTRHLVAMLRDRNWCIVSGLAVGIDTIAHQTALLGNVRSPTVAVLANGLDTTYPKSNTRLASAILSYGGALVSEQPFGAGANQRNLVQRDRLQSGLAAGTVVLQTALVGGSMHTVRFTLLQGRLLFASSPQGEVADESQSRGNVALSRMPGRELSKLLDATGEYAKLLESFGDKPVAPPIASRESCERMLVQLERAVEACAENAETPPA
jgi:DNA processing protein